MASGQNRQADVLVIGGGIAGSAVAHHLARAGCDVLLVERHDLNTEASGCNSGSLHGQIPYEPFFLNGPEWAETFAPTLQLMRASIDVWAGVEAELGTVLDVATPGGLIVGRNEAQMRVIEAKAKVERAQGIEVEMLDRDGIERLAPYISDIMIGGAFCKTEGKANPLLAGPAFARRAEANGARIERHVSVTGLMHEGDGYIARTDSGDICARRVVNCAGAGAGTIAAMLGIDLPVEAHAIQTTVSEPVQPMIHHLIYSADEKLSLKQTAIGTLLIGGGWPADLDAFGRPQVSMRSLVQNMRVALDAVPQLDGIQIVRSWAAIVNGTADWRPIIGEVPGHPGFFIAFFPWMGFTVGPLMGQIIADQVLGRVPHIDVSAFKPSG
jgi:sarcosine oxidase subunit beta